jgi:hypothetical protein
MPAVRNLGKRHVAYGVTESTMSRWARRCFGLWRKGSELTSRNR